MEFGLEGRRALVSGSTSGIGAATAKMLAAHGARVIVHGRNRERADGVVAAIRGEGGNAVAVLGDLSDDAQVAALVDEVNAAVGGIDILVSNAGDAQPYSPDWFAVGLDQWAGTYNRNVLSAVRLVQNFVPGMRDRGWGRVIMIGSSAYTRPTIDFPAYAPGKAALVNIVVGLARVLANTGITANIISPGAVLTETLKSNLIPLARAEGWTDTDLGIIEQRLVAEKWRNCVGRMARPEEIAAAVVFLAGNLAASMTGSNIRIDCGETASFH